MKKFRIIAATSLVGAALVAGTTLPASAATHSGTIRGGAYSYNDGKDTYCVRATKVNSEVYVKLSPVTAGRGPTVLVTGCSTELVHAYEDTKYKAEVHSWDNGVRSSKTYYFYS